MIVSNGKLIDTETGEILEDVAGLSYEQIGRLMYTKHRDIYEARKVSKENKRKAKAISVNAPIPPSDLSRRAVNWWRKIIQRGYMRRGILRYKNGKVLTKKAMASILECSVRNVEYILKELIEKGYVYNDGGYFKVNLNPNVTVV